MTTQHSEASDQKSRGSFVLPNPPEGELEDMTSFDHLAASGNVRYLIRHIRNPETTIVVGERYLTRAPGVPASERMALDLLIAFNIDPELYRENNGYIISEQGKPTDFVLEIASRSTGQHDAVEKRVAYAALGIPEYWRFDETGDFHGPRLAGDRLVDGRYEPVPIETVEDGVLPGIQLRAQPTHPVGPWTAGRARPGDRATHRPIRGPRGPCPRVGGGAGAAPAGLTVRKLLTIS